MGFRRHLNSGDQDFMIIKLYPDNYYISQRFLWGVRICRTYLYDTEDIKLINAYTYIFFIPSRCSL